MAQTATPAGVIIPEKERIAEFLKEVIDPELGINIIDLGLVYDIRIDEATGRIAIDMTLTTHGCPLGDTIMESAYRVLQRHIPGVEVDMHVVWEPAWSVERLTEAGRLALGR